jgi:predicted DNA-binding transcriptional regulator YafY
VVGVFPVSDAEAICSFLLGLGEDVEVLAPPALRARVAAELGARIGARSTSARR